WDLVRQELKPVFGERLRWRVPDSNPPVRVCVNAVNARLGSGRMKVCRTCKYVIRDLDGVERDEAGDIVKKAGDPLTHLSDGIRYYVQRRFPVAGVIGGKSSY